ncbi:MAG: response regulator [Chloroflexota bacterium]|nr:response regulator [Chloroflexota bacterium]
MQPKVLVVDDDRHIVGLLTQLFRDEGFEVRAATDGLIALDYIDRGEADVVVSDVMMPRLNGIELARMLQGRPVRVPLVLISAIPRQRDMPDVPFIRKPFDLDYLLRVVNELLDREADVIN